MTKDLIMAQLTLTITLINYCQNSPAVRKRKITNILILSDTQHLKSWKNLKNLKI